jgi:osmotically-inducible protein OsmY
LLTAESVLGCRAPGAAVENVENHVSHALEKAELHTVEVEWNEQAKVAHLTGTVEDPADKLRAENVAAAIVGTSGAVVNELAIEGMEGHATNQDGDIRERLNEMVQSDGRWQQWRDRDIRFEVHNGAVTITGEVRSTDEKNQIGEIVESLPGVIDVANALGVRRP